MTAHDWGMSVPAELPTAEVIEIRDKLRAGAMVIELPQSVRGHEKAAQWHQELNSQTLAAYEQEAAKRLSWAS